MEVIKLTEASLSKVTSSDSPEKCHDGNRNTFCETAGEGEYWLAKFEEKYEVSKVKITNRAESGDCAANSCTDRLALATVYIDDTVCGWLPSETPGGQTFEIKC